MDVDRILEFFNRHHVDYLLIGGMNFLALIKSLELLLAWSWLAIGGVTGRLVRGVFSRQLAGATGKVMLQSLALLRCGCAGKGSRDSSQGINGCGRVPKNRSAAVVPSGRSAR